MTIDFSKQEERFKPAQGFVYDVRHMNHRYKRLIDSGRRPCAFPVSGDWTAIKRGESNG